MFNLAAIPPGTLDLPLRRQAAKSLPGSQEATVPAAGTACVSQHSPRGPLLSATPCTDSTLIPGLRPQATSFVAAPPPHQRRSRSSPIPQPVHVSGEAHLPHQRRCLAHRAGRSGPGPGGRLSTAQAVGLCRGLGARGLPALVPPKPASPHAPDRLPAQRSTAFRALWHWETLSRAPAPATSRKRTVAPASPTRLRDSQHHRPTRRTTPQSLC